MGRRGERMRVEGGMRTDKVCKANANLLAVFHSTNLLCSCEHMHSLRACWALKTSLIAKGATVKSMALAVYVVMAAQKFKDR